MKNVIYILLAILILGCQKEDTLNSKIGYSNLYTIEDDPTDPVKHRIYEIYTRTGVPVYFNDTIGKIFLKNDIHGNPVYCYETLDLAWSFSSYSSLDYTFEYMTDPEEQMKALDIIEEFFEVSSKALYPFNFFVLKSYTTKDNKDEIKEYNYGSFEIYFRSVVFTGNLPDLTREELPTKMMRGMVKNRIQNYTDLLTDFYSVSKTTWFGAAFSYLDENYFEYMVSPNKFGWKSSYDGSDIPPVYYFSVGCFSDTWYAVNEFTPEGLENFRAAVRLKVGQFGFISSGRSSTDTPENTENDLNAYTDTMLNLSPEKFNELWGECPLVMKKYSILYKIIADELGVKL